MKYERPQVIAALRGVFKLFEDGDAVRNIKNDDDGAYFRTQGLRITKALLVVQEILEEEDKHVEKI